MQVPSRTAFRFSVDVRARLPILLVQSWFRLDFYANMFFLYMFRCSMCFASTGDGWKENVTPNSFFVGTRSESRELSDWRVRLTPSGKYFSNLYDDTFSGMEWQLAVWRRRCDASSKYVPRPRRAPFKVESTCFHLSRCPLLLHLSPPPSSPVLLSSLSLLFMAEFKRGSWGGKEGGRSGQSRRVEGREQGPKGNAGG